ncbi:Linoleate 10R-lipoxygenase [Hypsizygus marmoreus]|uniref:Linoleate 10R-lipoxygenase n=1 Tax=Hypsizygus marmoreus TaxID=39966 RepID=A0A369K238_HYPMA|nr:Linoleate 10R-lipoxygenase [Hypsizygus marmoreus]
MSSILSSAAAKVLDVLRPFAESVDYVSEIRAPYDTDGERPAKAVVETKLSQYQDLIRKPAFALEDLPAYWDAIKNQSRIGLDDRELLLEKALVLMARLQHNPVSLKIQQFVIALLYNDLPHPPCSYLSTFNIAAPVAQPQNVKYAYRSPDGSNYNPLFPSLGKAGSPYARSVPALKAVPKHALPDPGLVFDTLLKRDKFVEHPGGVSSLFFAFADLVIHSIFQTNHTDWTINDASSYLDLSILYGSSEAQVDQVRRKDGTGRLWDDVFADTRLLFMPPAACALLVLLSRNHNYIAQKLLDINENGTFVSPPPTDEKARLAQDDEIFNRTRMVNCGFFMQIILGDYVGAILGLARDGCDWRLDPLMNMRESDHEVSPRGEGNVVSIEFNLMYRWHSTLSTQDTTWTDKLFNKFFEGKEPSKVTIEDFAEAAHKFMIPNPDVRERTFGGLTRDENKRFKDDDLARVIQDATDWRAGAFRARGIPEALRVIEIMGIEQGRSWGTCSLNEFRKFLNLKPYKNFKEWNPDPEIHTVAAALYKDIDNLELHVGLQAEQAKEPGPGAGLCPGYTISRAILADAVCLTRGDRFLTTDFTPANLTAWGYDDCQYDKKDGSYGGLLTKLLFRTLPDHFPAGSVYAHFPFLDPVYLKAEIAKNSNIVDKYDWTRPKPPTPTVVVDTYEGVKQVLTEPHFQAAYKDRVFNVAKSWLTGDKEVDAAAAHEIAHTTLDHGRINVEKLIPLAHSNGTWAEYFEKETSSLVGAKTLPLVAGQPKYLDIVGDVINLLPVHWIAEEIIGLPLKTDTNQRGAWYEDDLYKQFADVGRYVFLNFDPVDDWHLREDSITIFQDVSEQTKRHLQGIGSVISLRDSHLGIESHHCHSFLKRALDANPGASLDEVSAYVFAAVVPTAAHFSQAIAHVVDFYLDKQQERQEIVRLAGLLGSDKDAGAKIMVYVREALRLNPPVSGVYRTALSDAIVGSRRVQLGERVFVSLVEANRDVNVFGQNAAFADVNRRTNITGITSLGEHGLVSSKFFESVVPAVLGTIFDLKNIRRAPGVSGKLAKFTEQWHGSPRQLYTGKNGKVTPFPDSLLVQFD